MLNSEFKPIFPGQRVNILGVGVHAINMPQAVQMITSALADGVKGYVCITGVHGVMEAQRDADFRAILNHSFLTTPDGMPTVWLGKWQRFSSMQRVYGPDLMLEVCRLSVPKGYTHFLFGGKPGVAERLQDVLEQKFPGIRIVGTYTPPFRPLMAAEENELARKVAALKPHCFWVGLSTPKQERFMAQFVHRLDTNLMFGVGAAFDINAGLLRDSPKWVKEVGLQWLHRLVQEPRRLGARYMVNNPRFVARVIPQLLGLRRYPAPPQACFGAKGAARPRAMAPPQHILLPSTRKPSKVIQA